MKKLLIIALCFTLTVQLSAQTQSDGRESVGMQNGSKHFDVAAHLRQLKINEMNNQARMKRVQSKPAALRTASPMHRNPGSVQPKAPARKSTPVASAKSRSAANNGGFWKYKEKLDSIVEDNGNQKRIFEYDYDGNVTSELVYYDYRDGKPHSRYDEYYDKFGYQSSRIDYNYTNDKLVPSTKYEYYRDQWGNRYELKRYNYQDGEWVLSCDSHKEVKYDNEGRLIYICDTQDNSKNEYYYDENGNSQDKARYLYISEEVGFVCTYLVTLDDNNRVISVEEFNITDWSTGECVHTNKYIYAYDENGNRTLEERYTWDSSKGDNGDWVASWKYECYWIPSQYGDWYDQHDKARYTVVNGEFVCEYNAEIDDQKRIISEEWFNIDWGLGTAVPRNKQIYVYNDYGERFTTDYYYYWDSEMEHYKYLEHTYYYSNYQNVYYKTSEYNGSEYVATSGYDVEFDDHGEVLKVTDVANPGNYTEYENAYNESGQLISQISKYYVNSGLNYQERHDFEYDEKGRLCLDLYSSWNGEDWTKSEKYEYNYEAFDTYNVGVYQKTTKLIAEEWRVTNEQGALKLDEGGYKEVNDTYDYDWSTGALTYCWVYESTYDTKGNKIGYKQAYDVTEDGMPQVRQEEEYVYILNDWGNNRITSDQSEWDYNQNKLVEKRKSTTEKTEEGVTILTIQTSYDGTEWTTESCYELEYDEDGVLISSAQLVNNEGTFTRNGATKYAKKYDSNGYTLLDAKYSGDENEHWAVVYEKRYEYYENGNRAVEMVEDRQYSWNIYKYEKRYDENGNQTFEEQYTWDSSKGDNGDWVASWKNEYYYTPAPSGGYYRHDKARYEVVNGEFVCTYNAEIDDQKRIISEERFNIDWGLNISVPSSKRVYVYDDFGNITKETTFLWDNEKDEWYIENQSSYTYTFDMNVLAADIAMKEGQYNGKYKLLSLESSEYYEWESSYYDNKTEYFYSTFGYYYYVDGESHEIIPDGDELVGEDLTLIDKQTYSADTDFTARNLTYKRTFVDSEWNALYVPFNIPVETLDEEGLQAAEILTIHIYDDDQDGTVDRTTIGVVPVVSGELEANVPYVIRAKELEEKKEVEINLSNILVHESENNSVDCSSTKQLFTFTGTYEPVTGETLFNNGLYYIGINAETQNVAIVRAGSAATPSLPAQRWTLAVTDRFGKNIVSNVRAIDIVMDEDATGIETIGADAESATDVYNVAGVKVATMTAGQSIKNLALPAGVYVNNGHKFIIK